MKTENRDEPILKNFVDCTEEELRRILSWRNSKDVRNNSFDSEVIKWPDHLKFVESLKKRKDKLYFLVSCGKSPLGVVSLSLTENGTAEVGYYKADEKPVRETKGVGVTLLRQAERAAKISGGGIGRLVTEVFSSNEASVKSVTRAGYRKTFSEKNHVMPDGTVTKVLRYELDVSE